MIVRELAAAECTELVSANRLARLACAQEERPYVVPIFYAYAVGCAYAFTLPGRKLEAMRANANVALLVEDEASDRRWRSVVAEGRFEELPDRIGFKRERDRAWSLLSRYTNWWEPGTLKPVSPAVAGRSPHVFFRIRIDRMSGREGAPD